MTAINHLSTKDGARCQWDREVGAEIAAWLKVHVDRLQRNHDKVMSGKADGYAGDDGKECARLAYKINWLYGLIKQVDDSWSLKAWQEATKWVNTITGRYHADPEATPETGDAQCDGIGQEPGP